MKSAVIGTGCWGVDVLRVCSELRVTEGIHDSPSARLQQLAQHPGVRTDGWIEAGGEPPGLRRAEAERLAAQAVEISSDERFPECIETHQRSKTPGGDARWVLKAVEASQQCLLIKGEPVQLAPRVGGGACVSI